MKPICSNSPTSQQARSLRLLAVAVFCGLTLVIAGCGTGKSEEKKDEFFTSGSRAADQRAGQTMAKSEQLAGSGQGAGEKGSKKARTSADGSTEPAHVEGKLSLYERLGGEPGISDIVADFLPRAMQDPRINWHRKGVKRAGLFGRTRGEPDPITSEEQARMEKHFIQFIALATGGPAQYDGKEMKETHAGMRITNPEFDATIGDLKATLDKLQVPNKEQKELLAIVESTRPQVVTER